MKKLLAILLAMMLVMVSAVALATDVEENNEEVTENQEEQTTETPVTRGGETTTTTEANIMQKNGQADLIEDTTDINNGKYIGNAVSTANQTIQIAKAVLVNPESTGDTTKPAAPAQTVSFTVTATGVTDSTASTSDAPAITIDDAVFGAGETSKNININIATAFPAVGVYTYKVEENIGDAAGMQSVADMELKITVIQSGNNLVLGGVALKQNGTKVDTIANEYDAGSVTVEKVVGGNLGDQKKPFDITITFNAPDGKTVKSNITYEAVGTVEGGKVDGNEVTEAGTIAAGNEGWTEKRVTLTLMHNQKIQFFNVPAGVTYTVTEADYTTEANGSYDAATIDGSGLTVTKAAVSDATVTNIKNMLIDTGVSMDSVPYMVLMAIALIGGAVLFLRKREEY